MLLIHYLSAASGDRPRLRLDAHRLCPYPMRLGTGRHRRVDYSQQEQVTEIGGSFVFLWNQFSNTVVEKYKTWSIVEIINMEMNSTRKLRENYAKITQKQFVKY